MVLKRSKEKKNKKDRECAPGWPSRFTKAQEADELMQSACLPVLGGPLAPTSEPPKDADEYLRSLVLSRFLGRAMNRKQAEYGFGEYGFKHRTQ